MLQPALELVGVLYPRHLTVDSPALTEGIPEIAGMCRSAAQDVVTCVSPAGRTRFPDGGCTAAVTGDRGNALGAAAALLEAVCDAGI